MAIEIVGHRGAAGVAPENTVNPEVAEPSQHTGIELKGFPAKTRRTGGTVDEH